MAPVTSPRRSPPDGDGDAPHLQLRDSAGLGIGSTPHRLPGIGTLLSSARFHPPSRGQTLTSQQFEIPKVPAVGVVEKSKSDPKDDGTAGRYQPLHPHRAAVRLLEYRLVQHLLRRADPDQAAARDEEQTVR